MNKLNTILTVILVAVFCMAQTGYHDGKIAKALTLVTQHFYNTNELLDQQNRQLRIQNELKFCELKFHTASREPCAVKAMRR